LEEPLTKYDRYLRENETREATREGPVTVKIGVANVTLEPTTARRSSCGGVEIFGIVEALVEAEALS
jgi:hypothetical protein